MSRSFRVQAYRNRYRYSDRTSEMTFLKSFCRASSPDRSSFPLKASVRQILSHSGMQASCAFFLRFYCLNSNPTIQPELLWG